MFSYFLCNYASVQRRFRIVMVLLMAASIHAVEWSMAGLFTHSLQAQTAFNATDKKPMSDPGEYAEKGNPLFGLQRTAQNVSEMNHAPLPIIDWNDQLKLFALESTTHRLPEKTQTASAWLLFPTIIVLGVILYLWRVNIVSNAIKYVSELMGSTSVIVLFSVCAFAISSLANSVPDGFGLLGI